MTQRTKPGKSLSECSILDARATMVVWWFMMRVRSHRIDFSHLSGQLSVRIDRNLSHFFSKALPGDEVSEKSRRWIETDEK